ncbi:MAG: chemotaxis protein CheA [Anaerolineae bacterium]|nr:chemotaxis protein CheA [Anaerolineae bacterium]
MAETLQFDLHPDEVEIFTLETAEQIQQLDQGLLTIEKEGHTPELIQRIFRAAHTLKGSAGAIGHHRMANLTHKMETVLVLLREGRLAVSTPLVDLLLEAVDALRLLTQEVSTREPSGVEPDGLVQRFQAYATSGEAPSSAQPPTAQPAAPPAALPTPELEKPAPQAEAQTRVSLQVARDSIAPAARALQVLLALAEAGEVVKSNPPRDVIERGETVHRLEVFVQTSWDAARLHKQLAHIGEISDIQVLTQQEQSPAPPKEPQRATVEPAIAKSAAPPRVTVDKSNLKTVRTSVERLDKLMNLVGELVTDRNRLIQTHSSLRAQSQDGERLSELAQAISHMASITDELQEEVMRARLLPLENVFNKFPRMVRDLARDFGKSVDLQIEGQETELDRSVIEEIADPLMHLLRNAIDHGIEPPEDRRAAGKPETGIIRLAGRSEGSHIVITVSDDGKGIDAERVRRSAVEKGLMNDEAAARLTENEVIDLIFMAGLSTSKKVTDVSGRGVGMDVVRSNVERLRGTVKVKTQLGQGTTFELSLPLTLAIMPVLLVTLEGGTYCIPLATVEEVLEIETPSIHRVDRGELVQWRTKLLPLLRLRQSFGLADKVSQNGHASSVVAVRWGDEHAGLVVDGLLGQQEIVIKNLGKLIGQVAGITGGAILGDGSVALIIDVPGLVKQATRDNVERIARARA